MTDLTEMTLVDNFNAQGRRLARTMLAGLLVFGAIVATMALIDRRTGGSRPAVSLDPIAAVIAAEPKIAAAKKLIRTHPRDARGYNELGSLYMVKSRETIEHEFYDLAEGAFRAALSLDPNDFRALAGLSSAQIGRHEFRASLATARRALRAEPSANAAFAVIVDSQIELGRYREAKRDLARWLAREPGFAAYTRVSYLRELHGDVPGAIEAMRLALSAGARSSENIAFVYAVIGHLEFLRGDRDSARTAYRAALIERPSFAAAKFGSARVEAAAGHPQRALALFGEANRLVTLPEYMIRMAETATTAGRPATAKAKIAEARAEFKSLVANNVRVGSEVAIFEADYGSPKRAVAVAREAWREAPSVQRDDALGWALTSAARPREGLRYAKRALRLGSVDPYFLYHAGIAARDAGDKRLAVRYLRSALAGDANFSPLLTPKVKRSLAILEP